MGRGLAIFRSGFFVAGLLLAYDARAQKIPIIPDETPPRAPPSESDKRALSAQAAARAALHRRRMKSLEKAQAAARAALEARKKRAQKPSEAQSSLPIIMPTPAVRSSTSPPALSTATPPGDSAPNPSIGFPAPSSPTPPPPAIRPSPLRRPTRRRRPIAKRDTTPSKWERIREKIGPTISIRSAYWNRDRSHTGTRNFLVGSAWLTLRPEDWMGFQTFFDGYVAANNLVRTRDHFAEVREGYVSRSISFLDIKVGRQVIVWGRADKINPTDVWTSRNQALLATDDEDQRLGIFSAQAILNLDAYRIFGIWAPEWRRPIIPLPPIPGVSVTTLDPEEKTQFGLKVDRTGGNADWSLSYFDGISKTPDLLVRSLTPPTADIGLVFHPIRMLGADLALNVGDTAVRAEAAYTRSSDRKGSDPLRFNSEFFAVLGADRTLFENFNLNAQILYKRVFHFVRPESYADPYTRLLAAEENAVANQRGPHRLGISVRPSYRLMNDLLELELAYAAYFTETSQVYVPKATYSFNDHLKGSIGGQYFTGKPGSLYGRLHTISTFYTELRFTY